MNNSFLDDEQRQKLDYLYKIDLWRKQGYCPTRYLSMDNDLEEIIYEYQRIMYRYGKESKSQAGEYVSQIGKMFGVELTQEQIDDFFNNPSGTSALLDIITSKK